MNLQPRDLAGMITEELRELEQSLRWGEHGADVAERIRGEMEGLRIGMTMLGNLVHLSGVAAGLARTVTLTSMCPGGRFIKGEQS